MLLSPLPARIATNIPESCFYLLLFPQGRLVIGDIDGTGTPNFPAGSLLGCPQTTYMSPERQARKLMAGAIKPAEDIWTLGVMVLGFILGVVDTGPLLAALELLRRLLRRSAGVVDRAALQAVCLRMRGELMPSALKEFVCACLREEPADRPTAAELLLYPFLTSAAATGAGAYAADSGTAGGSSPSGPAVPSGPAAAAAAGAAAGEALQAPEPPAAGAPPLASLSVPPLSHIEHGVALTNELVGRLVAGFQQLPHKMQLKLQAKGLESSIGRLNSRIAEVGCCAEQLEAWQNEDYETFKLAVKWGFEKLTAGAPA